METSTERLARELAIMGGGGPLSRRDWVAHLADQLTDVEPVAAAITHGVFRAQPEVTRRLVTDIQRQCAELVADPDAIAWRSDRARWQRLDDSLTMLSVMLNAEPSKLLLADERVCEVCANSPHARQRGSKDAHLQG